MKTENQTVKENMPMVYSIVRKLNIRGSNFEDAVQVGSIAMLEALRSHTSNCGSKLSTWMYNKIEWRLKDWLDTESNMARSNQETDELPDNELDSDSYLDAVKTVSELEPLLQQLVVSEVHGETGKETAVRLGISTATVARRRLDLKNQLISIQAGLSN